MNPKLTPDHMLTGCITNRAGEPLAGLSVHAFDQDPITSDDPLGKAVTGPDGRYAIQYSRAHFSTHGPELGGPDIYVRVYDGDRLLGESKVHQNSGRQLAIDLQVDRAAELVPDGAVTGRVTTERGVPAAGLRLRLYRHGFGGAAGLLAETVTREGGRYVLPAGPRRGVAALEVRAVTAAGEELPLGKPMFLAPGALQAEVDLVVPDALQPLAPEFSRLMETVRPHVGEPGKLAGAREDDERQDLTLLHHATGWDARLLAFASLSERLAADPQVGLAAEPLYGLLRAGLPSDREALARVPAQDVAAALAHARDSGIIGLGKGEAAAFVQEFAAFARRTRLAATMPGSTASFGQMLQASGLEVEDQEAFASIYLDHRGNSTGLWGQVEGWLGTEKATRLQTQGKLAALSGNSPALTASLLNLQVPVRRAAGGVDAKALRAKAPPRDVAMAPLTDPAQLVSVGLHTPAAWAAQVRAAAGAGQLAAVIPPGYAGATEQERLDNYAGDLARKVRISYPTQVIGQLLQTQQMRMPAAHAATATVLERAAEQGFRLGQTPIEPFLAQNTGVTAGLAEGEVQAAKQQVKALQRTYQITPSNEAMQVLFTLGLTSAYAVSGQTEEAFVERFKAAYLDLHKVTCTVGEPELVYRKAVQVTSTTYNLFAIAQRTASDPPVRGMVGSPAHRQQFRDGLVKQFPTMEALFGSLDYCECDHCRSVLSPAAYLVDLLQFLDPSPEDNFPEAWEALHHRTYPHRDGANAKTPYAALLERRPDLPHIPLTCENTNTAMPYIDLVNEILEYYVAHGKLEAAAAHDTEGATTAELLAEPQNVVRAAYDRVQEARYPVGLPFDLPLETARAFSDHAEVPLHRLLDLLRPTDALLDGPRLDRLKVFAESLGLSPSELALFTKADPLAGDDWQELYGLPSGAFPLHAPAVASAQATLELADADAARFREGMRCRTVRGNPPVPSAVALPIVAISKPNLDNSGRTRLTFDDEWPAPPAAGDKLVCDGAATLASAKTLARRLGLTYKELAEAVQGGFVNPGLAGMEVLRRTGVTIGDVLFAAENRAFYDANKDLMGTKRASLANDAERARFDALAQRRPETDRTGWEDLSEVQGFDQRVDAADAKLAAYAFKVRDWIADTFGATEQDRKDAVDHILLLHDPVAGCDFDLTTLRYASGRAADGIAFLRLNLFVRLWRKLGWSLQETDHALSAFIPAGAPYDGQAANLSRAPLRTAIAYLAHLKELDQRVRAGKGSRTKLLTLWKPIPTQGEGSLYAQLFLTRTALKASEVDSAVVVNGVPLRKSVFDHPLGQYLTDNVLLKDHAVAVQGALGLAAADLEAILEDAGVDLGTARLSLPNVSLLYRHALLARALGIPVRDLVSLKQLSGLDPFRPLHAQPLLDIADDHPFSQTLRFVKAVEWVKAAGLKVADLEFLLRHRYDATGPLRPDPARAAALLNALAEGVRAIEAAHALPANPTDLTEEALRTELALALAPDVVDRFIGLMAGTAEFTATVSGIPLPERLPEEALLREPAIRSASFKLNPGIAGNRQSLVYRGVLDEPQRLALQGRLAPRLNAAQQGHLQTLLQDIQKQAQDQAAALLDGHLRKLGLGAQGEAGFLSPAEFAALVAPLAPLAPMRPLLPADDPAVVANANDATQAANRATAAANAATVLARRHTAAAKFLPVLRQRLVRAFLAQTMTANTGADEALVAALLTEKDFLGGSPLPVDTLARLGTPATGAQFFTAADWTQLQDTPGTAASPDTTLREPKDSLGNALPAAQTARFEGCLQVPAAGAYRLRVALDAGVTAKLWLPHLAAPLHIDSTAVPPVLEPADLELVPGVFYRYRLDVGNLGAGAARLLVQGETLPKGPLAQLSLLPAAVVDAAERAILLMRKSTQLVQALGLTVREVRHILANRARFGGIDLRQFPDRDPQGLLLQEAARLRAATPALTAAAALAQARADPDLADLVAEAGAVPARVAAQFAQVLRLVAYARLKAEVAPGTSDLVDVMQAQDGTAPAQALELFAKLVRRDLAAVKAAADALLTPPALDSEIPMARLWEGLRLVEALGIPTAALARWGPAAGVPASLAQWGALVVPNPPPGTPPADRFAIATQAKEALKARLEPETWQRVAQPIFDRLRGRQRDALVAHVMHQRNFARVEQLYEYFLVDPGMEPVVQTSRIRLALGSVQLFIQRALLNLEQEVHPGAIHAKHWEWMKRYRVWEANRRIFLYPENWLEPEFRDDKTHLYREMETALTQGDVSNDLVEDAFLAYLKKLDELARLDIVAMYLEGMGEPAERTLHVFGRTFGQPHKHFYRRYRHGAWTPWEPVAAEIEGDHLAPVVWRDRLYLFWVTFVEKASNNPLEVGTGATRNADPTFNQLAEQRAAAVVKKEVDVFLHWSEYLEGEWSPRESGGIGSRTTLRKPFTGDFNPRAVSIHVAKAPLAGTGVDPPPEQLFIHLGGAVAGSYVLAGRNCAPEASTYDAATAPKAGDPYPSETVVDATKLLPVGTTATFDVLFRERSVSEARTQGRILGVAPRHSILRCDSITRLDAGATAAIEALRSPLFLQDDRHTLFVEADIVERPINEVQDWVTETTWTETVWTTAKEPPVRLVPAIPEFRDERPPGRPGPRGKDPLDDLRKADWATDPATLLKFGDSLIGRTGKAPLVAVAAGAAPTIAAGRTVGLDARGALTSGTRLVAAKDAALDLDGGATGLLVIDGNGAPPHLAGAVGRMEKEGFE